MEPLIYVTGNTGKKASVNHYFTEAGIEVEFYCYDFNEPSINDIEFISKVKVQQAYEILKKPCFAADSGFYIESYPNMPNYPGAFAKRSGISKNCRALLETMKDVTNRKCYFADCLTFYDGTSYYQFSSISRGTLSFEPRGCHMEKAKSDLWHVFIPEHGIKTLAEMTEEEHNMRNASSNSATKQFVDFYQKEYVPKNEQFIKQLK